MRMIAFTTAALIAMIVGYAFGLPPAVCGLIFLFVLFNGVLDRWAQPIFERLRA